MSEITYQRNYSIMVQAIEIGAFVREQPCSYMVVMGSKEPSRVIAYGDLCSRFHSQRSTQKMMMFKIYKGH